MKLTVFLTEDERDAFKILCLKRGLSMSAALRELVLKDLQSNGITPGDEVSLEVKVGS